LKYRSLIFDGAMGTSLQAMGLVAGEIPEEWNIAKAEKIINIHEQYIDAGATIITTNTFGANSYKMENSKYSLKNIIDASINNAIKARSDKNIFIAQDIGPSGRMLKPIGDMTFQEAYDIFKEQILLGQDKADILLFETFSSLQELRAGILAAKENSSLPIFCTMTFDENEITLTGSSPEIFAATVESLGVDGVGVNCSTGPKKMISVIKRLKTTTNLPIICQPNAGIPIIKDGITKFDMSPDSYLNAMKKIVDAGADIIGGCCGTTPLFIKSISDNISFGNRIDTIASFPLTSETKLLNTSDGPFIVGERINPSGNKKLKAALISGDKNLAIKEALIQQEKGAHILDINTSLRDINEEEVMVDIIEKMNGIVDTPLQIDSVKSNVIESALRNYCGIPIINSVNGKEKSMSAILPLAKKYGAHIIALTIDDKGIPKKADERFHIASKIISRAKDLGIAEEKIIVDCLTLTASAQQEDVLETVKAIQLIKENFNCKTALGLSNVSFGLPNRTLLNKTFLSIALFAGLDYIIANPLDKNITDTLAAYNVISNKDQGSIIYTRKYNQTENTAIDTPAISEENIYDLIKKGLSDELLIRINALLNELSPLEIINNELIPSLQKIGDDFEKNKIFLPQLIRAAETITHGFDLIKSKFKVDKSLSSNGNIAIATVQGDIHDIGKNLVKVMLESFNFNVIDLGKDVPPELVADYVSKNNIKLVGLSSLMTTTIESMEKTIKLTRLSNPDCKFFVGGAVITEKIAKSIGADYYCRDAMDSVRVAEKFFCNS
jgi:5-methyltetrahydrofolate--homocysteine methyltransferase